MNARLWVCLLFVVSPCVGLAAVDVPRSAPRLALSGPLADPGTPEATPSWAEPAHERFPLGVRLVAEAGAGVVSGVLRGGVGWFLGAAVCAIPGVRTSTLYGCGVPMVLGGLLGFAEGYALGVWWGGEKLGADGFLRLTMLGASMGLAAGVAITLLVAALDPPNASTLGAAALTLPLLPMLGAHLGYELFQRPGAPPREASRPSLQPLLSLSLHGAGLGLGGRF